MESQTRIRGDRGDGGQVRVEAKCHIRSEINIKFNETRKYDVLLCSRDCGEKLVKGSIARIMRK